MTVRDENKVDALIEMTHELAQQSRLAGSHFAGNEHEPFFGFDSVNQHRETFEVEGVIVKKSWVGRDTERRFSKSKVAFQQGFVFLRSGKFDHRATLLEASLSVRNFCKPHRIPFPAGGNTIRNSYAVN